MKALLALLALTQFTFAGSLDQPTQGQSRLLRGIVIQKLPSGLLINAGERATRNTAKPKGLVYVKGEFPSFFTEDIFSRQVVEVGTYQYDGVTGVEIVRMFIAK